MQGGFNPRTHTGCDLSHESRLALLRKFQSTHPHGVRLAVMPIPLLSMLFQSTHPHGVRLKPSPTKWFFSGSFNPRTHTGCDSLTTPTSSGFKSFNPRTHTGCDHGKPLSEFCAHVSIHAPTRGATKGQTLVKIKPEFQSTHPHGVRLM